MNSAAFAHGDHGKGERALEWERGRHVGQLLLEGFLHHQSSRFYVERDCWPTAVKTRVWRWRINSACTGVRAAVLVRGVPLGPTRRFGRAG